MCRKKTSKSAINALIVILTISFVVSAVFPDYSLEQQTANMEEADMDGQESSEEKKENKEQKESFQQAFSGPINLSFEQQDRRNHSLNTLVLQELYLPVITPPPDQITTAV